MNMMQALESRRMMSVDFSLSGLSSTLPVKVETTQTGNIYPTAKVTLTNKGSSTCSTKSGAIGVKFVLHPATGSDVVVGTIADSTYNGLKAGASKGLQLSLKLPSSGMAVGDYTLEAVITGETSVAGSNPNNNLVTASKLTVINSGAQLFVAYGFSDRLKFTKTTSSTVKGMLTETGTFVDANGVTGGYTYTIAPPQAGSYTYSLSLTAAGQSTYSMHYSTVSKAPTTLNGKTGSFSKNANGGVKATGSPNSFGTTVYFLTITG